MPPNYDSLKKAFRDKTYLFTSHASDRAVQQKIRASEIEEAIETGDVIEDYPNDKYGPSCLILGYTINKRALHIQVSYPENIKVITVYEPSQKEWLDDLKTRKSDE